MKKLRLSKETLQVLSEQASDQVQGGMAKTYTDLWCPTERDVTLCVPTVCHYRDCV